MAIVRPIVVATVVVAVRVEVEVASGQGQDKLVYSRVELSPQEGDS